MLVDPRVLVMVLPSAGHLVRSAALETASYEDGGDGRQTQDEPDEGEGQGDVGHGRYNAAAAPTLLAPAGEAERRRCQDVRPWWVLPRRTSLVGEGDALWVVTR